MKTFLTISLLLLTLGLSAQRTYIYGVVKDSTTKEEMIGAHVRNISAGSLTSTNEKGEFRMPTKEGDTLVISSVGHQTLAWVAEDSWFTLHEEMEFLLPANTIYLDEVVVGEFPEYERFKDMILAEQPKDTTFRIFGVPEVVMDPYPVLEKNQYLHPAFVFFHPISAMHHSFSKKEKEKRMMQQIKKRDHITRQARLKFTREWVGESTQLTGDKLTSFIAYCDFSEDYLASETLFAIHERMMELLPKFLEEYEKS